MAIVQMYVCAMQLCVTDLPKEDPLITGVELQYQIGDEINLNCTSGKSHPASILHWYINEQQVNYILPVTITRVCLIY